MSDFSSRSFRPVLPTGDPAADSAEFRASIPPGSPLLTMLTPAEMAVTMHVRIGLSNKEIAASLGKSPATVKAQVASILRKLEVPTRCRLIAWLYQHSGRCLAT